MVSEEATLKKDTVRIIINYFSELDLEEQVNILSSFIDGEIINFLNNEEQSEIAELLEELLLFLKRVYRYEGLDAVINVLNEYTLTESVFIKAIIKYIEDDSLLYVASSILRELDNKIFLKLVEYIILNTFLERNHASSRQVKEDLNIDLKSKEVLNISKVIFYCINQFYNEGWSFLGFSVFLEDKLGLSDEKITLFVDAMKVSKKDLDTQFIIRNIISLKNNL